MEDSSFRKSVRTIISDEEKNGYKLVPDTNILIYKNSLTLGTNFSKTIAIAQELDVKLKLIITWKKGPNQGEKVEVIVNE
ncbi:hypothetical protein [Natranaerobius thermophilus]|nr:hypothetical protein [Natranaerobius thermophilus]